MSTTLNSPRRSATPQVLAVFSALVLGTTAVLGLQSSRGQRLDNDAMGSVYAGPDAQRTLLSLLGRVSIGTALLALLVGVVLALVRGQVAAAVAAIVVVGGANVTTQLLKRVLFDRADFGLGTLNSLPSGHTTVVTSLVLATLLVAPPSTRVLLSFLGGFAVTLTGASTVVAGWHRPGDIIAAFAVSLLWAAVAATFLGAHVTGPSAHRAIAIALSGSALAGGLLVAVGVRPTDGWAGFGEAFLVLSAMGIAAAIVVGLFARLTPTR